MKLSKLLALGSLTALCALTGCAAASSSAAKPVQSSTAPATPSFTPSAAVPAVTVTGNPLDCTTIIDPTGWNNGPLSVNQMTAILTAVLITDGIADIISGNLSTDDVTALNDAETEFLNYSGNRLGTDAGQLASDIESYNTSAPDTSYGQPVISDILRVQRDCPAGEKLGLQELKS